METFDERNVRGNRKGKVISIKDGLKKKSKSSFLSDYFLVITFIFAIFLLLWSHRFHHDDGLGSNHLEMMRMKESFLSFSSSSYAGKQSATNEHDHRLAGLKCDQYGGPSFDAAQEMVYWEDILSDQNYLSPFHPKPPRDGTTDLGIEQFLTFEPDGGGWK